MVNPAMTRPEKGDKAPDFHLLDQNGNGWSLGDFEGHFLVLFFYKGDGTKYCTEQVQGFRDRFDAFKKLDAKVVGISRDDSESHDAFAAQHQLPFNLLSDPDLETASAFGIADAEPDDPVSPVSRDTFLIGPDGAVLKVYKNVRNTKEHADEVLEDLNEHVNVPAAE